MRLLLIFTFNLLVSFFGRGQDNKEFVELYNQIELKALSSAYNQTYQLMVSVPKTYTQTDTSHYPVFYVLDTEWNFGFTYDIYQSLSGQGIIPEMIIVGIGYGSSVLGRGNNRDRDMGPVDKDGAINYSDEFKDFIGKQLIPLIDFTYRTNSVRLVHGHSMGGLFLSYVLLTTPNLFSDYIISSPSLWWGSKDYILKIENEFYAKNKTLPCNVFLSMGEKDGAQMVKPWIKFVEVMKDRQYKKLGLTTRLFDAKDHHTVMDVAVEEGLKEIFRNTTKSK